MGLIGKSIIGVMSAFVLFAGVVIYREVEFNVKVIELPPEANAKCLDGSNYRFQLVQGSGEGKNKFLIFFEGGGLCGCTKKMRSTIEACRQRALYSYGQQIGKYSLTLSRLQNLFSNKKEYNPLFHNWNKINVHYCDGLMYVSDVDRDGLYIRGLNNTIGIIDYLDKHYNFKEADSVVVSGFSAGGIASMIYANYIDSRTTKPKNTFVIADSGFLIDIPEKNGIDHYLPSIFTQGMRYAGKNGHFLKTYCPFDSEEERWKCLSPELFIHNVKVPILLLQNSYDSWMISTLGGIECHFTRQFTKSCSDEEKRKMKEYADYTRNKIKGIVESNENFSAWLPNTIGHVFTFVSSIMQNPKYGVNNITAMDMITTWYDQVSRGIEIPKEKRLVTTNSEENLNDYKDVIFYIVSYKLLKIAGFDY